MRKKNNSLKIGLVLSLPPGYSETFFRNKIAGLQQHGFEVILFTNSTTQDAEHLNCTLVSNYNFSAGVTAKILIFFKLISKTLFIHFKASYRLFKLEKEDGLSCKSALKSVMFNAYILGYDLDWLHFGFGMLAHNRENLASAIGAKMAVSFRGFDLYLSPLKHPGCYDRLFKKDVKYHVLSNAMAKRLEFKDIPKYKIQVIPPAVDISLFKKNMKQKMKGGVVRFVTIARLHWIKGLEYTLEALSILSKSGLNFQYNIIGNGIENEKLLFAAHQLGIKDSVVLLGKMTQDEIRKQFIDCDIYLQYSLQEGFCNAVLEAQAMGLLCVVSNAEGLAENVLHEKTGWVVPKRQPKRLAEKIIEVLALSKTESQIVQNTAIQRVKRDFNIKQQNEAFVEFYKSQEE